MISGLDLDLTSMEINQTLLLSFVGSRIGQVIFLKKFPGVKLQRIGMTTGNLLCVQKGQGVLGRSCSPREKMKSGQGMMHLGGVLGQRGLGRRASQGYRDERPKNKVFKVNTRCKTKSLARFKCKGAWIDQKERD